jgi:hypothetical protein
VVSFRHNPTRPFDGHAFYRDFVTALHQLERDRPLVEERRRWWLALAEADRKDIARFVAHLNAQNDAEYYARQHTLACIQELNTTSMVETNGQTRCTRVSKWEYQPARDYGREAYQKRERDWRDHWLGVASAT